MPISGMRAALLVEAGFSGPADILEGKDGFARAYADAVDFAPLLDGLGSAYRMMEVAVKPHACSARVQSAVEAAARSEEHTSELQSLMRISYAVFCLKKKKLKY